MIPHMVVDGNVPGQKTFDQWKNQFCDCGYRSWIFQIGIEYVAEQNDFINLTSKRIDTVGKSRHEFRIPFRGATQMEI